LGENPSLTTQTKKMSTALTKQKAVMIALALMIAQVPTIAPVQTIGLSLTTAS
jgi:hypothetical protein